MSQDKRVLVIDDEPQSTTYLATLLADHGFSAHEAHSADEGLRSLEDCRPDLILLDLVMPATTGINLFNKIRKDARYQEIPIIIVTGIQEQFSEDYGAFFLSLKLRKPAAFLEKPVDPNQLIQTVNKTLGTDN
jgi:two-component system phosphate regulon response regulator PhoB